MPLQQDMRARPLLWISIISILFVFALFLRIGDFIDVSGTVLERFEFFKSPSTRLAENTARSNFTRMAWRRMYWGRLAAQRVVDEAHLPEIDAGWSAYINASADWNAEVMIMIVDADRLYGQKRRDLLENSILILFNDFDGAMRAVRRSRLMAKLRASQTPDEADRTEIRALFENVKAKHYDLNIALYDFALSKGPATKDIR